MPKSGDADPERTRAEKPAFVWEMMRIGDRIVLVQVFK